MDSSISDELYESFAEIFRGHAGDEVGPTPVSATTTAKPETEVRALTEAMEQLMSIASADRSSIGAAAQAVPAAAGPQATPTGAPDGPTYAETTAGSNTKGGATTVAATGEDDGSRVTTAISSFFESGFGIVPLITSLFGLFGSGTQTPPPLEKFQLPSAISFGSAETGNGLVAADYDQTGAPRIYTTGRSRMEPSLGGGVEQPAPATQSAPQITVNVQAMDAQSFLDRSGDIAQAVRSAMLTMSSINDVVNEL